MAKRICEWCGELVEGLRCKCGEKGDPYAYLTITNIVADMLGIVIDREELAFALMQKLRWRYRCPRCFAELPNKRVGGPAGDMENEPGACPRCERDTNAIPPRPPK